MLEKKKNNIDVETGRARCARRRLVKSEDVLSVNITIRLVHVSF